MLAPAMMEEMAKNRREAEANPERIAQLALVIDDQAFGMYLCASNQQTPLAIAPNESFRLYSEQMLSSICGPGYREDVLLRFLGEQYLLAHHTISRLQLEASNSVDPEIVRIKYGLAAQLLAEFRRLASQIEQFKLARKSTSSEKKVTEQQPPSMASREKTPPKNKVVSKAA